MADVDPFESEQTDFPLLIGNIIFGKYIRTILSSLAFKHYRVLFSWNTISVVL